jgi:hypothetical protein
MNEEQKMVLGMRNKRVAGMFFVEFGRGKEFRWNVKLGGEIVRRYSG